jgi:hypothetical protein
LPGSLLWMQKCWTKLNLKDYDYNSESVAYQHKLLQVENRASRDVQIEFKCQYFCADLDKYMHSGRPVQTTIERVGAWRLHFFVLILWSVDAWRLHCLRISLLYS